VLGMAANALRSFLASRAAGQVSSSAGAVRRSGAAGDGDERRWVSVLVTACISGPAAAQF
jgi:hypothetical protein